MRLIFMRVFGACVDQTTNAAHALQSLNVHCRCQHTSRAITVWSWRWALPKLAGRDAVRDCMGNSYYEAGKARAERVQDLFGDIASRYDLINDLQSLGLHRLWKRKLVRLAGIAPGTRALDVCCGTGDIAFALSDSGASVTGLDFSVPMLRVARARAAAPAPVFLQGDAQHLPFPDNMFDA